MKKIITLLSLSIFPLCVFAEKAPKPFNYNVDCEPVQKIQMKKKHSYPIKHQVVKPILNPISIPLVNNIDLNKHNDISVHYTNSNDVDILLSQDKGNHYYNVELFQKDGTPLTEDDFVQLNSQEDSFIKTFWMKSTLEHIEEQDLNINANGEYKINYFKSTNKCEALYVSYHLKGDPFPTTQGLLIGKNGESTSFMDKECLVPKIDKKDLVGYTEDNYITGFHWNTPTLSVKKSVEFKTFVTYEGQEITPDNMKSYAVSQDFTHFYSINGKPNSNLAYFGSDYKQIITYPGYYYFNMQFDTEEGKKNHFTAKSFIRE